MSTSSASTAGASSAGGLSAFGWISIGVGVLTVVYALVSKHHMDKTQTEEISVEISPPHTDSQPLPRVYGTCKVRGNTVWWGNLVIKDTHQSDISKRYY